MSGPIAVFDSGLGGLTVLRELQALMPQRDYIYVGDTARLPYGTKSAGTVIRYAETIASFLMGYNPAAMVVACNTASAVSFDAVQALAGNAPVVTMIEPAVNAAVTATRNGRIAVMATQGTCRSDVYSRAIKARNPALNVDQIPCQLLVALAEETWHAGDIARATLAQYLDATLKRDDAPDTLVLGCTHFPLFANLIADMYGDTITLINTGAEAAKVLAKTLEPVVPRTAPPQTTFFATDAPQRFAVNAAPFYGRDVNENDVGLLDLVTGSVTVALRA
jgi:glutamate racemase